jgi:fructose-1,6-bisphosphatase/inositol monophosphatase family enzyme
VSGADLILDIAGTIASAVLKVIADPQLLENSQEVIRDKGDGHLVHRIDTQAEDILFRRLREGGYSGLVFSEESGLQKMGSAETVVVCDPYCNTSITFRGFRESAVAVHEYTLSGEFLSGAIADLQTARIVHATAESPTQVRLLAGGLPVTAHPSRVQTVDEAFLTVSLLKRKRRTSIPGRLLAEAAMITTVDGAVVAARIAHGSVDGFVDASLGQPSYEALAYKLVRRAGGVVTDPSGRPFDFAECVRCLVSGTIKRHALVAASTAGLNNDILSRLG